MTTKSIITQHSKTKRYSKSILKQSTLFEKSALYSSVSPDLPYLKKSSYVMLIFSVVGFLVYAITKHSVLLYLGGGCMALAILFNPYLGLNLVGFSMPLTGMAQLVPGAFTATKGFSLLLLLSVLVRFVRIDFRCIFQSATMRIYALMMLWATLIFPFSNNYSAALDSYLTQLQLFGLALLITILLNDDEKIRKFAWWCLVGAVFLGGLAMLKGGASGELSRTGERLSAGMNENELSEILGVILFLTPFCFLNVKFRKMRAIIVLGSCLLVILTILFTYSRSGVLGIIAAGAIGPVITRKISMRKRFAVILIAVGLSASGLFLLMSDYFGSTSETAIERMEEHQYGGSGGRIDWIWPAKLNKFFQNPLIGGGIGTDVTMRPGSSHNDMIHFLSNQGLPAFLLFILLNLLRFRESNRTKDTLIRIALVSLTLFNFMVGLTHTTFLHRQYPIGIGVVAAVVAIEKKQSELGASKSQEKK
jgi:O-antigen ligase